MAEIKAFGDLWKEMGIAGVFYDEAEYGFGTPRQRQNEAVDYAHSKGLSVFSPDFDPTYNPTSEPTHLGPNDIFLLESFQIILGSFRDPRASGKTGRTRQSITRTGERW